MAQRAVYRRVGVIALVSLLALTACHSGGSASVSPGTAADSTPGPVKKPHPAGPPSVSISAGKVTPSTLTVDGGATVKVVNNDSVGHRLDNRPNHIYSGTIPAKSKGELTMPPDPGTYVFIDPNHTSTRVTLKVR